MMMMMMMIERYSIYVLSAGSTMIERGSDHRHTQFRASEFPTLHSCSVVANSCRGTAPCGARGFGETGERDWR